MTQQNTDDYGKVTFADEVIAIIAGLAATEIPGVAGMSGGLAGGIVEMLGRKNLSKGVKVVVGEKEMQDGSISVRGRKDGSLGTMSLDAFKAKALKETADKSNG